MNEFTAGNVSTTTITANSNTFTFSGTTNLTPFTQTFHVGSSCTISPCPGAGVCRICSQPTGPRS